MFVNKTCFPGLFLFILGFSNIRAEQDLQRANFFHLLSSLGIQTQNLSIMSRLLLPLCQGQSYY